MKIKKSLGTFTKFLSYLPLMRIVFKVFYTQALKKIKTQYINQENIIDIYLTSNIYSKNFIYGQSDYNLLIIVDNQTHPKSVLKEIRSFIKSSPLLELTINRAYLPVLTQNEYKTSTIKSFLVRKSMKEQISWFSLFDDEKKTFLLRKQDKFALQHNAIQSIDYFMLKEHVSKLTRVKFKQISNSALIINRFYPDSFPLTKLFYKLTARLHRFNFGLPNLFFIFIVLDFLATVLAIFFGRAFFFFLKVFFKILFKFIFFILIFFVIYWWIFFF